MYRGTPSLIFDVPEFPTLRRIKPLPKRRRTMGPEGDHAGSFAETPAPLSPKNADANLQTTQNSTPPLDPLIPPGIAEELLSRVDNVSTRMALQNYYLPILGNVQNFLATHGVSAASEDGSGSNNSANAAASAAAAALAAVAGAGRNGPTSIPPLADIDSIEFGVHFAAAAAAAAAAGLPMGGLASIGTINVQMGPAAVTTTAVDTTSTSPSHEGATLASTEGRGSGKEEGRSREDDYASLVGQPGNTKKRKVPANLGGSPRGLAATGCGSPSSSYLDEDSSDSLPGVDGSQLNLSKDGDREREEDSTPPIFPPPPFPGQLSMLIQKKGKLTAAMLAGLQNKEQLKARKKQLAVVMGALSHGDTLALDQALSFNHPLAGQNGEPLKVRKSKRRTVRMARAMNILMERPDRKNRHPDAVPFPETDFAFNCPSSTTDRLITTKEEIATLRKRFEAELDRRAAKLASEGSKTLGKTGRAKRERQERERVARVARQKKAKSDITAEDPTSESIDVPATGVGMEAGVKGKPKPSKKKKRSALANASNPHHLRNYVPSRLPHSGPVDGLQDSANNIWPLPVRFLSAETPTKERRSKVVGSTPLVQTTQPGEEWICAFCEYELFYGDEGGYRKAVRSRKKILRRRKRAAERAAAAASGGNSTAKTPPPPVDEECDEGGTNSGVSGNAARQRNGRWKEGPDKEVTLFDPGT